MRIHASQRRTTIKVRRMRQPQDATRTVAARQLTQAHRDLLALKREFRALDGYPPPLPNPDDGLAHLDALAEL